MKNNLHYIDHLIYTASSLAEGMQKMETLFGVKPQIGGRHPSYGTRNALLSLGEETYLEIIAPDPGLPTPEQGRLFKDSYRNAPKLTTWVLRSEEIENLHSSATSHGIALGSVTSGSREQPDGTVLSWKLTDPYAFPCEGTIPFLIGWGDTPHPAQTAPKAGALVDFEIEYPHPDKIQSKLQVLNVSPEVRQANEVKLAASIETKNGIVILK